MSPDKSDSVKANFYIREDQLKALREAAEGDDSRGNTITDIVKSVLDEAGFSGKKEESH
jgi:hypothetical protein